MYIARSYHPHAARNVAELTAALHEEWARIPQGQVKNFINSICKAGAKHASKAEVAIQNTEYDCDYSHFASALIFIVVLFHETVTECKVIDVHHFNKYVSYQLCYFILYERSVCGDWQN